jgi:hypothetical protein
MQLETGVAATIPTAAILTPVDSTLEIANTTGRLLPMVQGVALDLPSRDLEGSKWRSGLRGASSGRYASSQRTQALRGTR